MKKVNWSKWMKMWRWSNVFPVKKDGIDVINVLNDSNNYN